MRRRKTWLFLSAFLFVAWLGWLGYLAATASRPVVLRRPQFLASNLDVVAKVSTADHRPSRQALVRSVLWPSGRDDLVHKIIRVENLPDCVMPERNGARLPAPGDYILPLV